MGATRASDSTPKAQANLSRLSTVRLTLSRSIWLTYVLLNSAFDANSSCVMPAAVRKRKVFAAILVRVDVFWADLLMAQQDYRILHISRLNKRIQHKRIHGLHHIYIHLPLAVPTFLAGKCFQVPPNSGKNTSSLKVVNLYSNCNTG